jgi:hypothetical protein
MVPEGYQLPPAFLDLLVPHLGEEVVGDVLEVLLDPVRGQDGLVMPQHLTDRWQGSVSRSDPKHKDADDDQSP